MDEGFSLTEVMVAVAILLVVLGGMTSAMVGSTGSIRDSRDRQMATAIATDVLERARALPVASLAMRIGDPAIPGATADPDGVGPLPAEAVAATVTGAVTGAPYTATTGRLTTRTVVTWYDDPLRVGTTDTRRVTTTVTWTTAGQTEVVRASTLVSALARGVP